MTERVHQNVIADFVILITIAGKRLFCAPSLIA